MFFPPDIAHLGYGRSGRVVNDDERSKSGSGYDEAPIKAVEPAVSRKGRAVNTDTLLDIR